jgi:hypothetical protein
VTELQRVTGPSSPIHRRIGRLIAVLVVALLVAIAKPWGSSPGPSAVVVPSVAPPTTTPRPSASSGAYDFLTFGTNEPPPGWELWPAGRLASFSYAMRIDMAVRIPAPAESPAASEAPTPPPPTPAGTPNAAGVPATWPGIRIPRGSILDLIGINRPLGYALRLDRLVRIADDGTLTPVRSLLAVSPWPNHFTTVGYAADPTGGAMSPWPAGHYRLDLSIDPGGVHRTIDIVVEGSPTAPSVGPGSSDLPTRSPAS